MGVDERILGCVERGSESIGSSTKQVVYWYVEDRKGLKLKDIPKKPEEFVDAIKEMFGIGASTLERAIVREMVMEFGIALKVNSFVDAVKKVKAISKRKSESKIK